jgi:hypothetical protein
VCIIIFRLGCCVRRRRVLRTRQPTACHSVLPNLKAGDIFPPCFRAAVSAETASPMYHTLPLVADSKQAHGTVSSLEAALTFPLSACRSLPKTPHSAI